MGKNQHVTPNSNGTWNVKGEGNSKATAIFDTQKKAIDRATKISINQQSELIIHDRKGKIRERNSYGNDPHPPKG
ncbi:DUF2188 domain-containing protein [Fundicoccus culcitae]|uniref:DUF2188 domain-containing protein n=1 Tax=Fundicoccus culcitae TaxID=2969821 RepID=A0ABY5PAD7_9LACT|nr:DUF2188 domain-containing protein [Fundicoccus culcitae]UUX35448.1 DUF2188 domain-containing protein [Fundicoccus culcitae]